MRQSDLAIEKYWVTQSVHFRLATTVALGMGITYGKLLYCHGVAGGGKYGQDNLKIGVKQQDSLWFFNNIFTDKFGSLYLYLPPITIAD